MYSSIPVWTVVGDKNLIDWEVWACYTGRQRCRHFTQHVLLLTWGFCCLSAPEEWDVFSVAQQCHGVVVQNSSSMSEWWTTHWRWIHCDAYTSEKCWECWVCTAASIYCTAFLFFLFFFYVRVWSKMGLKLYNYETIQVAHHISTT